MTIEEKAKRYDEAIEVAKDSFNYPDYPGFIRADVVFPELKESEDEKIRKELLNHLKEASYGKTLAVSTLDYKRWADWLEKQGEQKPFDYEHADIQQKDFAPKVEPKFKVGDIIIKSQNSDINKFGKFKITGIKDGRYWYNEFVICEISEQDKWELARIEPKFKVGDWVFIEEVDGYKQGPFQIKEITQYSYTFDKRGVMPFECESLMTPWTIQDAEDGDVLATEIFIFIFKNIDNGNGVHYYCHYEISKHEDDNQFGVALPQSLMGRVGNSISHYSPATKEQRGLLFSEMKKAGYEWNAEKKKLKKISQRMISAEAKETLYDKPAWSEEDERNLNGIIDEIEANKNNAPDYDLATYDRFLSWIKSLRPQNGWKPSEEQMQQLSIVSTGKGWFDKKPLRELYEQLKKLREE